MFGTKAFKFEDKWYSLHTGYPIQSDKTNRSKWPKELWFGAEHLLRTGYSASVSAITCLITAAPAGPAVGIAALTTFVTFPALWAYDKLEERGIISTNVAVVARLVTKIAAQALLYGGLVALGIISLPLAAICFSAHVFLSFSDSIAHILGNNLVDPRKAILASLIFKIAVISAAAIAIGTCTAVGLPLVALSALGLIAVEIISYHLADEALKKQAFHNVCNSGNGSAVKKSCAHKKV